MSFFKKIFALLLIISPISVIGTSKEAEISDKINFDETPSSSSSENSSLLQNQNIHDPLLVSTFSCGPSGCNSSYSNNSVVETQILVHVKTKVNLDHHQLNKGKVAENISDIPILYGYRGFPVDNYPFPQNLEPPHHGASKNFSGIQDYKNNRPTSAEYNPTFYENERFNDNNYDRHQHPNYLPTSVSPQIPTPLPYYEHPQHPKKAEIPYFYHTNNKHYFREDPPQQNYFLPKRNPYNPVEFPNNQRNQWKQFPWSDGNNKNEFSRDRYNILNPLNNDDHLEENRNYGNLRCACRNNFS